MSFLLNNYFTYLYFGCHAYSSYGHSIKAVKVFCSKITSSISFMFHFDCFVKSIITLQHCLIWLSVGGQRVEASQSKLTARQKLLLPPGMSKESQIKLCLCLSTAWYWMTNGVQNLLKIALDAMLEFHRLHYTTRCMLPCRLDMLLIILNTTKTSLRVCNRQYLPLDGVCHFLQCSTRREEKIVFTHFASYLSN